MQKVTLKYDVTGDYTNPRNYTMEFDMSEMSFEEFLSELKKFSILVGYHPQVIEESFPQD